MLTTYQYDPNALPDVEVSSITSSAYCQDTWDLNELWTIQPGVRLGWYNTLKLKPTHISKGNYINLDPRISIRRKLDLTEGIYENFGVFHQYLTLMSADISTPYDYMVSR